MSSKTIRKTAIKPGVGFRLLKTNEVIRKGDQFRCTGDRLWSNVYSTIGNTVKDAKAFNGFTAVRRRTKVKAAVPTTTTSAPTASATARLKLGDRVVLVGGGYIDGSYNPKWGGELGYVVGTVKEVNSKNLFLYSVAWSNAHTNTYREGELVLLQDAPPVVAGPGYRLLDASEYPVVGDEYVSFGQTDADSTWTLVALGETGKPTVDQRRANVTERFQAFPAPFSGLYFRRKIEETPKPAIVVPAGYRLLTDAEKPEQGDRYLMAGGSLGVPVIIGLKYTTVSELLTRSQVPEWLGVVRPLLALKAPKGYRLLDPTEKMETGDVYLKANMKITEDTVIHCAGKTLADVKKTSGLYGNTVAIARKLSNPKLYTQDDLDRAVGDARKSERASIISLIRGV